MSATPDWTAGSICSTSLVYFGRKLANATGGPHGSAGGRGRALRVSGGVERPLARSGDKMATRSLLEVWAVLDCRTPR